MPYIRLRRLFLNPTISAAFCTASAYAGEVFVGTGARTQRTCNTPLCTELPSIELRKLIVPRQALLRFAKKQNSSFKSMLRLSIAAVLTLSGVLVFIPQAHAKNAWKEDKKLSKEYAEKGKWNKACSYGS